MIILYLLAKVDYYLVTEYAFISSYTPRFLISHAALKRICSLSNEVTQLSKIFSGHQPRQSSLKKQLSAPPAACADLGNGHSSPIVVHSSMVLQTFVGPWPLLHFRNPFYTVGRTAWTSDHPFTRPLPTHRTAQTQNKRTHRHTCLEWDSNPQSQYPSERRQFMS
jgi:hypothetical protein